MKQVDDYKLLHFWGNTLQHKVDAILTPVKQTRGYSWQVGQLSQ